MDHAFANALKRQKELQKELAEIDEFLRLYQQFSKANQDHRQVGENGDEPTQKPKREPTHGPVRKGPKAVVDVATGILKDMGDPMTRGELATELELRKVRLPGKDKESRARYVGTILWRNTDRFENVQGKGYWLKGVPVPETEEEKRALRLDGRSI